MGSLDSILVKAQTVVKDDVLLISSRPERSGGVHKGKFYSTPTRTASSRLSVVVVSASHWLACMHSESCLTILITP